MQVLLLTDQPAEEDLLIYVLQKAGVAIRTTHSISHAIDIWPENPADFILWAAKADNPSILHLLVKWRAVAITPIVLITNPVIEEQHIELLDKGVDQVIFRPYSANLLIHQIRALLRRGSITPSIGLPVITYSGISLDPTNHSVTIPNGEIRHLTQLEFRLLYTLITHPGQVIPADTIIHYVWGYPGEGGKELLRGLAQRLRVKIEPDPHQPAYIITEPGVGYAFRNAEKQASATVINNKTAAWLDDKHKE